MTVREELRKAITRATGIELTEGETMLVLHWAFRAANGLGLTLKNVMQYFVDQADKPLQKIVEI